MIPGATPTHTFHLPIDTDDIVAMRITYEENGKTVLTKELKDCVLGEKKCVIRLSQDDTLKFGSNSNVRIQFKCRTKNDDVIISQIIKKPTAVVLDKEVI